VSIFFRPTRPLTMCFENGLDLPAMGPNTTFVHAGLHPDPSTGAVVCPIYQTSTFAQEAPGVNKGFMYSRNENPTRAALEEAVAALEHGRFGLVFGSGLAAVDAVMKLLQSGDEVVASHDLYGGTYAVFAQVWPRFGITFHFVDMDDIANVRAKMSPKTRLIWMETPTNPLMRVLDIRAVAEVARDHPGVRLVVDNTFASPALQTPLNLGADIVMHSATKYLAGHSDVVQGALVTRDPLTYEDLRTTQRLGGAIPGPMDCFLVLRGIRTLGVRMERHCKTGAAVARALRAHPLVRVVRWPGFEDDPRHTLAMSQMSGFGGMVSFELRDGALDTAVAVVKGTRLFTLAVSLGGVESLICHPATMTHACVPREERLRTGLSDGLIRLSVGLEDAEDLVADLKVALALAHARPEVLPVNGP
jgi:cystathionine beta-lyase/cystathionine gamma-synthase